VTRAIALAILACAASASADPGVVDPTLGYLNETGFYLARRRVELGVQGTDGDRGARELQLSLRLAGVSLGGARSLSSLHAGGATAVIGVAADDGVDLGDRRTMTIDLRPIGYSVAGVLQVDALPVQLGRERRVDEDLGVVVSAIGITGRLPLASSSDEAIGGAASFRARLAGYHARDYVQGADFRGAELGSIDLAATLLLGESFWGTRRTVSGELSIGGAFESAVGRSVPGATAWLLGFESYADAKLYLGDHALVFARGRLRWIGDTGNHNVDRVPEAMIGVRALL